MKKKKKFLSLPSNQIILRYSFIAIVTLFITAILLPIILNYPPESINTPFDIKMSMISYTAQFSLIGLISLSFLAILVKLLFRKIDAWFSNQDPNKYKDSKTILAIRKKCFNLPYIIFFTELIVPIFGVTLVLVITGSHASIMILKILMILLSFLLLFSVTSYIFSKDLYAQILSETYNKDMDIGFRVSLTKKIIMQVLPICIVGILITALIGYSKSVKSKEDALFSVYHYELTSSFDKNKTYTYSEITEILDSMHLYNENDSIFIIKPDKSVVTYKGNSPSYFVVEYTKQLAQKYEGRTYDSYAVDTQGASILLNCEDGSYYVGILYPTDSVETFTFLLFDFMFLFILILLTLLLFSNSLSRDINTVSNSLNNIIKDDKHFSELPIISNDEIGDLCLAYNKVQKVNYENMKKIRDSQELLVEKERLASLGQMIGGIAHNLKTPIMAVSGATEGLLDLTKELDASIGNSKVTEEDFHAIASDMNNWIEKIKVHISYMSDVITAVKGQAVTFSEEQIYPFTISDLFKQVEILMRHELKSSLINLNIIDNTDSESKINGNINSLVQIINNMISNSIQAYNNKPNENIDLSAKIKDNNIVISVQDYGPGLPEIVKDKLFKEMVTTKGKSGTGLGLFMSYSNVRAHLNGNITFETSSKGTTFFITIPIAR